MKIFAVKVDSILIIEVFYVDSVDLLYPSMKLLNEYMNNNVD